MIVSGSHVTVSPETKTIAQSDAGRVIDKAIQDQMDDLKKSHTVGGAFSRFEAEFVSVVRECLVEDWDGYGAISLDLATIDAAWRFANVIPLGIQQPSVGAEPDGHITFEWHAGPEKTLSVSIDKWANVHYSALLGADRVFGTESFVRNIPARLLDLIYQVAV
jgi:hypothetical protein